MKRNIVRFRQKNPLIICSWGIETHLTVVVFVQVHPAYFETRIPSKILLVFLILEKMGRLALSR